MVKHYFQTPNPDLVAIQKRLVFWFKEHEYEVDSTEADGSYLVQARKTGKLRTLTGTNVAFKIRLFLSEEPNEFVFQSSTGQWTQNITGAGVTALFTGGITLLTGAAGAAWTMKVERDIVEFMEHTLQFKKTKTLNDSTTNAASSPAVAMPPPLSRPPLPNSAETTSVPPPRTPRQKAAAKAEEDLRKLEQAHAAGILDDQELATKKSALQAKTDDYEVQFIVEEKSAKLKAALNDGIIEQAAFESKCALLEQAAREGIEKERRQQAAIEKLSKLKSALENGILSQEEYDAKAAEFA